MRAVLLQAYDLDFNKALGWSTEHPIPQPKAGQVVVKVAAAASNPVDYKVAEGNLAMAIKLSLPKVTGGDFAGTIHSIPDGVDAGGLKVGDRVAGFNDLGTHKDVGSFAEYTTVNVKNLAKLPPSMSFEEGAALPLTGNTSYQALTEKLGLKKDAGQKLLVLGGSTATGMLALQMARDYGCKEIACTSSSVELCKSLGATEVVNYKTGAKWDEVLKGRNFDMVYDTVGGADGWAGAQKVLKPKGGQFATIAGDNPGGKIGLGTVAKMAAGIANRNFWATFGYPKYNICASLSGDASKGLSYFIGLCDAGKAKAMVDPTSPYEFSKEGALKMFEKQKSGTAKGKLVMKVE